MTSLLRQIGLILGLFLASICALGFIIGLIALVVTSLKSSSKYETNVFGVLNKLVERLNIDGIEKAVNEAQSLDDLSKQIILPSHRKRVENFLQSIYKTLKQDVRTDKKFDFTKIQDKDVQLQEQNKRIKSGVIDVYLSAPDPKHPFNSSKFIIEKVAKITVAAVRSLAGDWYLVLPDHDSPATCIEYLCVCDDCRRKVDPFSLKQFSNKKLCPSCRRS